MKTKLFIFIALLIISNVVFAQRPGGGGGRPPQGDRPDDRNGRDGQFPPRRDDDHHGGDWQKAVDSNKNGKIEADEFRVAADTFFKLRDKNNNGVLEESELSMPRGEGRPPKDGIPPFLFIERDNKNLTRADFDAKVNLRFTSVDANGDGVIDNREMTSLRPSERNGERMRPPNARSPLATFIGAEMRFGDKIVKDAPFSAETVREENKRLFDGSLIKNESKGLIYRDGFGRIRLEQPFEFIGGFAVVGENNQPKRIVNIVDAVGGNSYSIDAESKTYFKYPMRESPPFPRRELREDKIESLGAKNIEGVNAEGTRITREIPAGEIGNDKPIYVVTEKWFSPDLQVIVLSKHSDPFIGEVVFKLVNIKPGEPAAELFKVPNDYKLQNQPKRDGRKNED
jgi:EF hand